MSASAVQVAAQSCKPSSCLILPNVKRILHAKRRFLQSAMISSSLKVFTEPRSQGAREVGLQSKGMRLVGAVQRDQAGGCSPRGLGMGAGSGCGFPKEGGGGE